MGAARSSFSSSAHIGAVITISTPFINFTTRDFFPTVYSLFVLWRAISIFCLSLLWLTAFPTVYDKIGPVIIPIVSTLSNHDERWSFLAFLFLIFFPIFVLVRAINKICRLYQNKALIYLEARQQTFVGNLPQESLLLNHVFVFIHDLMRLI